MIVALSMLPQSESSVGTFTVVLPAIQVEEGRLSCMCADTHQPSNCIIIVCIFHSSTALRDGTLEAPTGGVSNVLLQNKLIIRWQCFQI